MRPNLECYWAEFAAASLSSIKLHSRELDEDDRKRAVARCAEIADMMTVQMASRFSYISNSLELNRRNSRKP